MFQSTLPNKIKKENNNTFNNWVIRNCHLLAPEIDSNFFSKFKLVNDIILKNQSFMMMENMSYITYSIVLIFSSKIIPFHLALLFFNVVFFFFHMGKKTKGMVLNSSLKEFFYFYKREGFKLEVFFCIQLR